MLGLNNRFVVQLYLLVPAINCSLFLMMLFPIGVSRKIDFFFVLRIIL